jgi:hypothetical protein
MTETQIAAIRELWSRKDQITNPAQWAAIEELYKRVSGGALKGEDFVAASKRRTAAQHPGAIPGDQVNLPRQATVNEEGVAFSAGIPVGIVENVAALGSMAIDFHPANIAYKAATGKKLTSMPATEAVTRGADYVHDAIISPFVGDDADVDVAKAGGRTLGGFIDLPIGKALGAAGDVAKVVDDATPVSPQKPRMSAAEVAEYLRKQEAEKAAQAPTSPQPAPSKPKLSAAETKQYLAQQAKEELARRGYTPAPDGAISDAEVAKYKAQHEAKLAAEEAQKKVARSAAESRAMGMKLSKEEKAAIAAGEELPPIEEPTGQGAFFDEAGDLRVAGDGPRPQPGKVSLASEWFEPISRRLRRMGNVGPRLANALDRVHKDEVRASAKPIEFIERRLAPLSKQEQLQVRDILSGTIKKGSAEFDAVSKEAKGVARRLRVMLDDVLNRAKEAGVKGPDGEEVGFIEDYFPSGERKGTSEYRSDRGEAGAFSAYLQKSRGEDVTYSDDVTGVLTDYFRIGNRKIAETQMFGDNIPNTIERIVKMAELKGVDDDPEYIRQALDAVFRGPTKEISQAERKVIGGIRNFATGTKMMKSAVLNAAQPTYAMTVAGGKVTQRAIKRLKDPKARAVAYKMVRDSGAYVDTLTSSLRSAGDEPLHEFAAFTMKRFGMDFTEGQNRFFAAVLGDEMAQDFLGRLKGTTDMRQQAILRRDLEGLGVDVDAALKNGDLSYDDRINAMLSFSERTQHAQTRESLPVRWLSSPWAQVYTQFKKYGFKQIWREYDDIVRRAITEGNEEILTNAVPSLRDKAAFAGKVAGSVGKSALRIGVPSTMVYWAAQQVREFIRDPFLREDNPGIMEQAINAAATAFAVDSIVSLATDTRRHGAASALTRNAGMETIDQTTRLGAKFVSGNGDLDDIPAHVGRTLPLVKPITDEVQNILP